MTVIRPDLTPILASLRVNDWIEVVEDINGEHVFHEGKFHLFTATHLHMYIHQGECKFANASIELDNIISIVRAEDKCPKFIVKS